MCSTLYIVYTFHLIPNMLVQSSISSAQIVVFQARPRNTLKFNCNPLVQHNEQKENNIQKIIQKRKKNYLFKQIYIHIFTYLSMYTYLFMVGCSIAAFSFYTDCSLPPLFSFLISILLPAISSYNINYNSKLTKFSSIETAKIEKNLNEVTYTTEQTLHVEQCTAYILLVPLSQPSIQSAIFDSICLTLH